LLPLLANDCERTKRSRSGSIELPARSLFFSVSVSLPQSNEVDQFSALSKHDESKEKGEKGDINQAVAILPQTVSGQNR
jgi:hypothetical protein